MKGTASGLGTGTTRTWSDPVSVDTSGCGEKNGSEPDDCREWGDSRLQNAGKSTHVALSPNESLEQDIKLTLS